MNRIVHLMFCFIILNACSSSSKINQPENKSEIPIEILNKRGISAINSNYKSKYFELLPYLFFNKNDTFNEIQGDFYNVDYQADSNINIMPGFWRKYGEFKNVLIVLIAKSNSSKLPLKDLPITVESIKHGVFKKVDVDDDQISRIQQRVLFVKELDLENKSDILNKVKDDVITITISGQIYKFLNPELELN